MRRATPPAEAQARPLAGATSGAALSAALSTCLRQRAESSRAAASIQVDYDQDRQRLADALDASKAREAALEDAAQDASDALDRAIEALRQYATEES